MPFCPNTSTKLKILNYIIHIIRDNNLKVSMTVEAIRAAEFRTRPWVDWSEAHTLHSAVIFGCQHTFGHVVHVCVHSESKSMWEWVCVFCCAVSAQCLRSSCLTVDAQCVCALCLLDQALCCLLLRLEKKRSYGDWRGCLSDTIKQLAGHHVRKAERCTADETGTSCLQDFSDRIQTAEF